MMFKKIICTILVLSLLTFAAACKEDKSETVNHDVDIAYFADMGAFPESEIKIGDAAPEENPDDGTFFFTEYDNRNYFSNGDFCYYYAFADESKKETRVYGISAFSKCMGFEIGAISVEVTDVLDAQNIEYYSGAPREDEVFFLPKGENREVITCKKLKNNLVFVFEDNALCAVYLGEYEYAANSN